MNLNALVAPIIEAINPWTCASFEQSSGYTTGADGKRAAAYATAVPIRAQKQPLAYKDLMQIQGLNINGEKSAFYVDADWKAIDRPTARGGDLLTLPDQSVWLVIQPLENWHDTAGWTKVAAVKQMAA